MSTVALLRAERVCANGVHLQLGTSLLPAPRPRLGRGGAYLPSKYRKYRDELARVLAEHIPADKRSYAINITIYREYPVDDKRYGDLDNLLKTVMDALGFDDVRVLSATACKRNGEPRVLMTVEWE